MTEWDQSKRKNGPAGGKESEPKTQSEGGINSTLADSLIQSYLLVAQR